MQKGTTFFGACEVRCWRWLFGNRIPVSLSTGGSLGRVWRARRGGSSMLSVREMSVLARGLSSALSLSLSHTLSLCLSLFLSLYISLSLYHSITPAPSVREGRGFGCRERPEWRFWCEVSLSLPCPLSISLPPSLAPYMYIYRQI